MVLVGSTTSRRMSVGCGGGYSPAAAHSHSLPYSRLFVQDGFSKIKRIVGLAEHGWLQIRLSVASPIYLSYNNCNTVIRTNEVLYERDAPNTVAHTKEK